MIAQASPVLPLLATPALPLAQAEPPLDRLINGLAALILLLLVGLCLVAFVALLRALLPNVSERSRLALVGAPWRAFWVGLANYLFLGGISLALFSTEIDALGLIGLLILAGLTLITALGLPGLAQLTGQRLDALHSQIMSPAKQLVWGTSAILLAGLLPFAGWFLLTPILLMTAFGAAVLGWRNRRSAANDGEQPHDRLNIAAT